MSKKYRLLFDIRPIIEGNYSKVARCGIYFCTLNILSRMLNKYPNFDIYLYSPDVKKKITQKILSNYFDIDCNKIITPFTQFEEKYKVIKKIRHRYKKRHNYVAKTLYQMLLLLYSPIIKIFHILIKLFYLKFDYYFSTCRVIPQTIENNNSITKCVILHDVIPIVIPDLSGSCNNNSWPMQLFRQLNGKDWYLANSEYTRQDFLKYFPVLSENNVKTVLHACNDIYKQDFDLNLSQIKEKYNIPQNKKYIFSLCSLEPRKNLIRILKTFIQFVKKHNIDDLVYVMGGNCWEIFEEQLRKEISNLDKYKDKFVLTGYIKDEDLPALYKGAEWFVYTSQYEGFGVPPLEAMSCGCPVIVSNNTSLPEVVGDAGILVDWDSDEQHIEAYKKYYYDEQFRQDCIARGLQQASKFSWDKSTEEIVNYLVAFRELDLTNKMRNRCKQ